jgi:hypothetical protein
MITDKIVKTLKVLTYHIQCYTQGDNLGWYFLEETKTKTEETKCLSVKAPSQKNCQAVICHICQYECGLNNVPGISKKCFGDCLFKKI